MTDIQITIDEVRGKGRPRFFKGHAVTDKKTRMYEAKIAGLAEEQMSLQELTATNKPVTAIINIFFGIPKSYTNKRREDILKGEEQPLKKPDIDNVIKSVLDGCNGVIYEDDSQVIEVIAKKSYSENFCGIVAHFIF